MKRQPHQRKPLYDEILEILGFHKTDAKSNLEAKRGCRWANRLIVATIEALEHFDAIQDFYYKEDHIDRSLMFSDFLEKKGGCLDCWQAACKACLEEKTPPNADEAEVLDIAGGAFWQALYSIVGIMAPNFAVEDCTGVVCNMRDVLEKDSPESREGLRQAIQFHTLNVAETCYRLKICEWKIWFLHKDWPIEFFGPNPDDTLNGRMWVKTLYPALEAFDKKQPFAFYDLGLGLHGLSHLSDLRPKAFIYRNDENAPLLSFEKSASAILTMATEVSYEYPPELADAIEEASGVYFPSRFLLQSRNLFLVRLYDHFCKNAEKPLSDATRRLWLEAAAKLLQNMSLGSPVYKKEEADAIIALAHKAQYESWIEHMMERAKKKKGLDAAIVIPPAQPEPVPAKAMPVNEEAITDKLMAYVDGRFAERNEQLRLGQGGRGKPGAGKPVGKKSKTRGRQTETMLEQFGRLQQYLTKNHVVLHCKLETLKSWIHSFWLENKAEFEKAAKAKDQEKGYGSEAMMVRAAVNKGYGPERKKRGKQ